MQQDAAAEQPELDVQPTKILQRLLKRAVEKFGERYSGWLEEELSSFLNLKDSKDPIMKDYYLSAFRKCRESHSTSVRKRIRYEILDGVTREVVSDRAGRFVIAFAQINLRQSQIRLNNGDKVHLQGFLTPGLNPNVYATGATSDDPARRLSLQLTGENHGCNFQVWLTVRGDKTAMMVNTLVDILEGATYDEIEKWPRRMLRTDGSKGRTKIQYTS
jgi:hypothetical protein